MPPPPSSSNPPRPDQPRAVALVSGGLDSLLAARMMLDQGVYVEGLNFFTGFCVEGHTHAIRRQHRSRPKRNNALWVAERLGIKLHIIDVIEDYKEVVINPKHGYGANLNPCLDCKSFMVSKAREWMEQRGFDFIVTGEVIGQRPKSQTSRKLPVVAAESGAYDRLLRPLSARLLEPTLPERRGWVDRDKLEAINGRSRTRQMALAAGFGIRDYAQPAGGCCFLTDAAYSNKLRDLWRSRGRQQYDFDDIMLLKVGRHLRPRAEFKLIIARDQGESRFLEGYRRRFAHFSCESHPGPFTLVQGDVRDPELRFAARVVARFGQGRDAEVVRLRAVDLAGREQMLEVTPLPSDEIPGAWYL